MARSLVGTRIRERRRAKKMSQKTLAARAGISQSYMNLIEHNHRSIAGRTLLAIAEHLEIDSRELSDDANLDIMTLLQSAAQNTSTVAELHRLEEYVARFPGWAALSAQLFERTQMQWDRLQALSDRLGTDPFFSEAMHLMLSNVTVIKSTSEILATTDDIDAVSANRFLANMQAESTRLTDTISKLLRYFDESDAAAGDDKQQTATSQIDAFLDAHQFFLPILEREQTYSHALFDAVTADWDFGSTNEETQAHQTLERYHNIAQKLPIDQFIPAAKQCSYNPQRLAQDFSCNLHDVFFRLAHLPPGDEISNRPDFGLIECDGSGGVLFRKALKNLSLPRKSSACPLWPLYRAISQPMQPIKCLIETPTGDSFLTFSAAQWSEDHDFGLPGTVKSAMLFTADHTSFLPTQDRRLMAKIPVGLNCEVCPRVTCKARRAPSILDQR